MSGVVSQEVSIAAITPTPVFSDIIFLATFDGVNGATDADDLSQYNADLKFYYAAALSNAQATLGLSTSLRCQYIGDWVSSTYLDNSIYHSLGDNGEDFTIELFLYIPTFQFSASMQWVGIWQNSAQSSLITKWRLVSDSVRLYFQCRQGGQILQYSVPHGWFNNTWYHVAVCRSKNSDLRFFINGVMVDKRILVGGFDSIPIQIPLTVGGSFGFDGCNAFIQDVRVTKGAWYTDDAGFAVPTQQFGAGDIHPRLMLDNDIFDPPALGQVVANMVTDSDAFYSPSIGNTPTFFNSTVDNGNVSSTATTTLVSSRAAGALLLAFVRAQAGNVTFSVGGGWTIGDTSVNANGSTAWAWRIVDGTEASPVWPLGVSTLWQTKMFQFRGNNASPIGAKGNNAGASTNITISGITTTANYSMVLAILETISTAQNIPLPAGYIQAGAIGNFSGGSDISGYQNEGTLGTVSSSVNVAISTSIWKAFLIEIKP
jgi:hypothetical protein